MNKPHENIRSIEDDKVAWDRLQERLESLGDRAHDYEPTQKEIALMNRLVMHVIEWTKEFTEHMKMVNELHKPNSN